MITNQSLLEGMAAGCAIIALDVGYTNKIVPTNIGNVVNNNSVEIANAIIELLDNPMRTKQLGGNARKQILQNHNIDNYLRYLDQLYDLS